MNKILTATSRGQVTLPKNWRDKFNTNYFEAEIHDDQILIKPFKKQADLEGELEKSWKEYEKGDFISHEEMVKKYGL